MASSAIWKLEDDSTFAVNCFPARGMSRTTHEGGGSWIVAYAHEQQKKFNSQTKKRTLKPPHGTTISNNQSVFTAEAGAISNFMNTLGEEFLLKHHHIESPLDLCSVNISGCDLEFSDDSSFSKFENVAYVNAAENLLSIRPFRTFPHLRELELPVNGIRNIDVRPGDFPTLHVLDLSYNNVSSHDMLALGFLPHLKVLTLTGNGISQIHPDLCQPFSLTAEGEESYTRFQNLEVLLLDDNHLHDMATFAALAALPSLRELNLDKNNISLVPYLKVVGEKVMSETHSLGHTRSVSAKKSSSSRAGSRRSKRSTTEVVSGIIKPLSERLSDSDQEQDENTNSKSNLLKENVSMANAEARDPHPATPPFQNLRILSLANNKISEEEHLLAVAGWPSLQALILHGNPLVTNCKGEPPLLSHYLRKRLGMSIIRFKPKAPVTRPNIKMPGQSKRKVNSSVPKIPKQPVDAILERFTLPALTHTPHPPDTVKDSKVFPALKEERGNDQENVFLTQFQDEYDGHKRDIKKKSERKPVETEEKKKFSLLELFDDVTPDPEIHENLSIQSNVKMLHHILQHPIAYNAPDPIPKNRLRKYPFVDREDVTDLLKHDTRLLEKPNFRKTKSKQLEDSLRRMREKPASAIEIPLFNALHDSAQCEHREEAEFLLEQIEKKYRVVREESLRASRQAKRAFQDTKAQIAGIMQHIGNQ